MSPDSESQPIPGFRVRPYAITGGRTRPLREVAIETLLVRTNSGGTAIGRSGPEKDKILRKANEPVSLAEISAELGLVIGVSRVLVGDLLNDELLTAHDGASDDRPDVQLLERVLDGLKSL